MGLVINETSFSMFEDKYMALKAIDNLLGIVEYLYKEFDISINDIYCNGIDAGWQITKDLNIKKFINFISDKDRQTLVLSLLGNTKTYTLPENRILLYILGQASNGASFAFQNDEVMLSLCSSEIYNHDYVKCSTECQDKEISIKNVSLKEHIFANADYIPIRIYERNPKHAKDEYIRSRGEEVSVMDLPDDIAQRVLNKAHVINNKLYGIYNDNFYEFKRTHKHIYHGYRISKDHMEKHLQLKILNGDCF